MTIVDQDGNELKVDPKQDPYINDMLELTETIKKLVTEIMLEKDLTYFQVLGAVSTIQSQMVATLLTDERNIIVKQEAEE